MGKNQVLWGAYVIDGVVEIMYSVFWMIGIHT